MQILEMRGELGARITIDIQGYEREGPQDNASHANSLLSKLKSKSAIFEVRLCSTDDNDFLRFHSQLEPLIVEVLVS